MSERKIHVHSNRGDFAMCGAGAPSPTVVITTFAVDATCKNCLKINRSLEQDRRRREMAREYRED